MTCECSSAVPVLELICLTSDGAVSEQRMLSHASPLQCEEMNGKDLWKLIVLGEITSTLLPALALLYWDFWGAIPAPTGELPRSPSGGHVLCVLCSQPPGSLGM